MSPGFVHEVFAETASQHPQRNAIEWNGRNMTYAELGHRAAAVACSLETAGVKRGSRVVVFADNSFDVPAYMLGVLKCGCAFVPLAPTVPRKRLESMLLQADASAALVAPGLGAEFIDLAGHIDIPVVDEHQGGDCCSRRESIGGAERSGGDDLSYLVYTSGSTGVPKPIAGRLRAIDHFVRWEIDTFGFGPGRRVSQLFSPMFDAFLRDVFAPLCSGGTICIPPSRHTALDGATLGMWLHEQRITHVHTVPSVLRLLLDHAQQVGGWPHLQHILVAGEALTSSDVRRWFAVPGVRPNQLINLYGPSETTMTKFVYAVQAADEARRAVPIGKPMPGAKAIVVDDAGHVCPPGVVGEIYIRTPFSSLGYFGQPELTREVFIQNPYSKNPDDIVYKTGDLGRVLDDGNFELVGRRDHQVKLRGVRIELGEVEAALTKCPGVSQCVVVARQARSGMQLVAYVVMHSADEGLDTQELRRHLRDWLPAHSMPDIFVQLDTLPLTPNGKVDRKRLPPVSALGGEDHSCGPRDGEEEVLCGIFADVLDRSPVGIYESFFEIGGHSLLATQLVSRVRNIFKVDLPLRTVFESPTVAELVGCIRLVRQNANGRGVQPISRTASGEALVLSYAQDRLWFLNQLDPVSAAYNLTFALRLKGRLDVDALGRAVRSIMQSQDVLRTSFPEINGAPTVAIHADVPPPLEVFDLRNLPAAERSKEVDRLLERAADTPFHLDRAPLFRLRIVQLADDEYALSVTVHHIISDAWSTAVFVRELTDRYDRFVQGAAPAIPAVSIQYHDFAAWERSWLSPEDLQTQLDYWRQRLAGCPPALLFPTDCARPAVQSFRGGTELLSLSSPVTAALRRIGRQASATEFMTVLALMNIWLYGLGGQEDILIGTPVSNRNHTETEKLIGLFLNTLVLRNQVAPDLSFRAFLADVRANALEAYAHQAIPFERLIDDLHIPRDASRNPLIQVMLNIEHLQPPALRLRDLEVQDIDTAFVRSRFDLHIGARPKPEGLELILIYNAELFRPGTAKAMLEAFGELAGAVAASPDANVAELAARARRCYQESNILKDRERAERRLQRLHRTRRTEAAAEAVSSGR